jgi:glycerol-3-phosphate acyltransferase PlsY
LAKSPENLIALAFLAVIAYLYGAIPFAYLATYLFRREKLTEAGTRNVGVINAFRTGGVAAVILTIIGEVSKSLFCVGLAELLFPGQDHAKLLAVLAAFVGTNFSIFLLGRGGRGSTMLMWSIALISFYAFLILAALIGLCFLLARLDVRLKSLWFWFVPAVLYLVERDWAFLLFGILVALVIFVKGRHSRDDLVHYGYVRDKSWDERQD